VWHDQADGGGAGLGERSIEEMPDWQRTLSLGLTDAARALEKAVMAAEHSTLPAGNRVGLVYALRAAADAVERAAGTARRALE
jgi:hypothetical protein